MRTIFKYPFALNACVEIEIPDGADILSLQMQGGEPCLWAMVDPVQPKVFRTILCIPTGAKHSYSEDALKYLATIQAGVFVWHFFELLSIQ